MRENLRVAAPYVSIFGLLLLVGAAVVAWLASPSGATVAKDLAIPSWLPFALAAVGVLLTLAYPALRWEEFAGLIGGRRTRYGTNALVSVIAVIGILAVLAFLGSRRYRVWDLTANKQYSISRQTLQILNALAEPVALTAIVPSSEPPQASDDLERLMEKYEQARPGQIEFTRLVPQFDPIGYQALQDRTNNDAPGRGLVAESGKRHAVVYNFDEQAVSEAILKVTRDVTKTVLFTTGHGEIPPEMAGEDGRGYGIVRQGLEREGYVVNTAAITGTVPDADVVVVAGPQRAFQPSEAAILGDFVAGGGALMLLLDPMYEHGLDSVLLPWDVRTPNDLVIDPQRALPQSPTWMMVPGNAYEFHTVTKGLEGVNSLFPASRSISTGTPITTELQVSRLVGTSDSAWGETQLEALKTPGAQPAPGPEDTQPPMALAVAADGGAEYGRMVVFGTAGLAVDGILQQFRGQTANGDLFLNSVNWLTQEEELIAIRPTQPDDRPMNQPSNPIFLLLATSLFMPAVVLGVGAWVYWRRR